MELPEQSSNPFRPHSKLTIIAHDSKADVCISPIAEEEAKEQSERSWQMPAENLREENGERSWGLPAEELKEQEERSWCTPEDDLKEEPSKRNSSPA